VDRKREELVTDLCYLAYKRSTRARSHSMRTHRESNCSLNKTCAATARSSRSVPRYTAAHSQASTCTQIRARSKRSILAESIGEKRLDGRRHAHKRIASRDVVLAFGPREGTKGTEKTLETDRRNDLSALEWQEIHIVASSKEAYSAAKRRLMSLARGGTELPQMRSRASLNPRSYKLM
jgi:hypothetical protein